MRAVAFGVAGALYPLMRSNPCFALCSSTASRNRVVAKRERIMVVASSPARTPSQIQRMSLG